MFKWTINPITCFVTLINSATGSMGRGTGAYEGISGPLPVHGEAVLVLPRLKNGGCNETSSVVPINETGEISGSSKLTLPAPGDVYDDHDCLKAVPTKAFERPSALTGTKFSFANTASGRW